MNRDKALYKSTFTYYRQTDIADRLHYTADKPSLKITKTLSLRNDDTTFPQFLDWVLSH